MSFALDSRLKNSSFQIAAIDAFQIRLVNDKRYIWLLIIPEISDITELDDLDPKTQTALFQIASQLSSSVKSYFQAHKMNIATIGNIVSQFHLHIVARKQTDATWPEPIWGKGTAEPYSDEEASVMMAQMRKLIDALPPL